MGRNCGLQIPWPMCSARSANEESPSSKGACRGTQVLRSSCRKSSTAVNAPKVAEQPRTGEAIGFFCSTFANHGDACVLISVELTRLWRGRDLVLSKMSTRDRSNRDHEK